MVCESFMSESIKKFPNALNDGSYVGPFRAEAAFIMVGALFTALLTREMLLCMCLGFALLKFWEYINEKFEETTMMHVMYAFGLPVCGGHLFDGAFDKEYLG